MGISKNLFWKFLEQGASQIVQLAVSIILARLLGPDEYGIVAIVLTFINILAVVVQNGFATALIQRMDVDEDDFNSVLYFNLVLSGILYLTIYILAPFIAGFYKYEIISSVTRILSLMLFPSAVISLQQAYVARKMEFSKLFVASFIAALISGGSSIYLAYKGMGIWALVCQQMVYLLLLSILLMYSLSWRIKFKFSLDRVKSFMDFGVKYLAAAVLDNVFNNLHSLVMAKVYSKASLANFNRGEQFPKLIVSNLSATVQAVLFPVMSAKQNDKKELRDLLERAISVSCYIVFPMMFGMMAVADTVILLFLGPAWEEAIGYVILMSMAYALWPIHMANLQAINALGRSDIFLKLELVKKLVSVIVLIIGVLLRDVLLFVVLKLLADIVAVFINSYPNNKLLDFGILQQLAKIYPSFILSIIMSRLVYMIGSYMHISSTRLIVQVCTGIAAYILLSIFTKNEDMKFLYNMLRKKKAYK